jgi:hypothetical protein
VHPTFTIIPNPMLPPSCSSRKEEEDRDHGVGHAFIGPFIDAFIHPFIDSCMHPSIDSCIHGFRQPPTKRRRRKYS